MCYEKEVEQPSWSSSLHAFHHLHLTESEALKQTFEIEIVKSQRRRPSLPEKDSHLSIIVKG